MAGRKRKGPWRRSSDNCWYTTVNRKVVKVAPATASYDEAFHEYCNLHAASEPIVAGPRLTVSQLFDQFLEWCQQNRSANTYRWYGNYIKSFHQHHGPNLRVEDLRPYHVDAWLQRRFKDASDSHKFGAIRSVQRALNWAVKQGYIATSPLAHMEKPTPQGRETVINSDQFNEMIELTTDDAFKDFLTFLWETGCRPQELRALEAKHFDGEKLTLEKSNSKGKRFNRTIYLNTTALEIIQRLMKQYPKGKLFRNSRGRAWKKDAVLGRFKRLKRLMDMDELCATTLRHSWITNALKTGLDVTTVATLAGHRNIAMVARVYQHLGQDHKYLQSALDRIKGVETDPQRDEASDIVPTVQA